MNIDSRILVIAAHPDDMEYGCAGTIAKFIDEGATVDLMIVVRPGDEITEGRDRFIVTKELESSLEILDLEWRTLATQPGRPHVVCSPNTVTELDRHFGDNEYDLVISNDPGDYHQDHVETFKLANSFCRKNVKEFWTMESLPYANRNTTFTPNVFVDIDKYFETKLHMLSCYKSVLRTSTDYAEVTALSTYRAAILPTAFHAEAFQQHFRLFDDNDWGL